MDTFRIASDHVSLGVTGTGGHLSDVTFTLPNGRTVQPMHTAPWANETLAADTPEILRMLRGDFFCAPFGSSNLIASETRVHGLAANGTWRPTSQSATRLDATLDGTVMGATISKTIEVIPGQAMIYERHTLHGGNGRLPIGHHAMLSANHPLQLGFSRWKMALSTPELDEVPPGGRSLLAPGQTITDLHRARRLDGTLVDLTQFPSPKGFESIWMLVADRSLPFAWTAATCASEGWIWFAIKDPNVLPETLFWFSNGGRDYAPWNGRHRAIGLEEICGYFHLGHKESVANNPVSAMGSPTAVTLEPTGAIEVRYMFGLAEAPAGFGAVTEIAPAPGGVRLADAQGHETLATCNLP